MATRTISTVRDIFIRNDTGKKTTPAYTKANPKNVTKSHEAHSYEEKIKA